MPIKFKCSCGAPISVSSKLAGKTGKCPKCGKPVKVPSPQPKPAAASAPATSGGLGAAAGSLDSLFDEAGLVEKTGPTCPNCHSDIKPGTRICTSCGLNFETGDRLEEFNASVQGPEFENPYLQEASENMVRDLKMDERRDRAQMPWWVIMSFLIGAMTLCAAGVIIVDGQFSEPSTNPTLRKIQAWTVFATLGLTGVITGGAIMLFANLSITAFAYKQKIGHGIGCTIGTLVYPFIFGIMNWKDCKAAVKALVMGGLLLGGGIYLVVQGGGFNQIVNAFR